VNNTQFDLYLSEINEDPDKLKQLFSQLFSDNIIEYKNGHIIYTAENTISEYEDEIKILKSEVKNYEENIDFLESEIEHLKLRKE